MSTCTIMSIYEACKWVGAFSQRILILSLGIPSAIVLAISGEQRSGDSVAYKLKES